MTANFDDSDMKIADGQSSNGHSDRFDAVELVEELKAQRFNGNTAKAKALGANIVSAFSYKAAPEELYDLAKEMNIDLDEETVLQIKILAVFSAEYCLNNFLPSPMLSAVAVNALYDVLKDVSPDFYEQLSSSSAFSLYYMGMREKDVAQKTGEQFAMLCGKKNNESYITFGKKQHELNVQVYKTAIRGFAFA